MYKFALNLIVMMAVVGAVSGPTGKTGIAQANLQPMTVRGEISDSTCAAAGSHGKMMNRTHAKDATECTLSCVKSGSQFVLYNTDDKSIYRLDSEDKVKPYAGQTVTVIGNYDRATDILHVDRIETGM